LRQPSESRNAANKRAMGPRTGGVRDTEETWGKLSAAHEFVKRLSILLGQANELQPGQAVFASCYQSHDASFDNGDFVIEQQLDEIRRPEVQHPFQTEKKPSEAQIQDRTFSAVAKANKSAADRGDALMASLIVSEVGTEFAPIDSSHSAEH